MARFIGGPCDGQTVNDIRPAERTCGGQTYIRAGLDYYLAGTEPSALAGTAALGTHAPKAWADLQKALGHRLPTSLQRSRKLRRATMRTLSRRRRVR